MIRQLSAVIRGVLVLLALAMSPSDAFAQTRFTDQERDTLHALHAMQGVTIGMLGATAALGSIQLYNMPTIFDEGGCARDRPAFGSFACTHRLSVVHALMGALTVGSYVATAILDAEAPEQNRSATENSSADSSPTAGKISQLGRVRR